jgi:hypothetical protein
MSGVGWRVDLEKPDWPGEARNEGDVMTRVNSEAKVVVVRPGKQRRMMRSSKSSENHRGRHNKIVADHDEFRERVC